MPPSPQGRPLTTLFKTASLLLERFTGLVLLVELPLGDVDGSPSGQVVRMARSDRHISAGGKVYQAAALKIQLPSEEGQGRLGSASIVIGNASRLPQAFVEQGRVVGRPLTVRLALQDDARSQSCTLDPAAEFNCLVMKASATAASVTLELGHAAAGLRSPAVLFTREKFPSMLPVGGGA